MGCAHDGEVDDVVVEVGCSAFITLSIESGDDGSLESLSKSSVSGLNNSKDINFGTTTLVADIRRTIGKLDKCLNFGIGGKSLIVCRVIFGKGFAELLLLFAAAAVKFILSDFLLPDLTVIDVEFIDDVAVGGVSIVVIFDVAFDGFVMVTVVDNFVLLADKTFFILSSGCRVESSCFCN